MSNFELYIKNAVDAHEMPFDNAEWVRLEKSLPKSNFALKKSLKYGAVAGIIIAAGIYYINQPKNNNASIHNSSIIETKETVKENKIALAPKSEANAIISQPKARNIAKATPSAITVKNNTTGFSLTNFILPRISEKSSLQTKPVELKISNSSPVLNNGSALLPEIIYSNSEGCAPFNVQFKTNTKADTIDFAWSFGDGTKSSLTSPTHTYYKDGSFDVTVAMHSKLSGITTVKTYPKLIKVNAKPNADFDFEAIENYHQFKNQSIGGDQSKWDFGDKSTSVITNPKHIFGVSGQYTVKLISLTTYGCADTAMKQVETVFPYISNAFSPNGDGQNDKFGPKGNFTGFEFKLSIYNGIGHLVFESNDPENQWDGHIKGSSQPAPVGTYFYDLVTKDPNGNIQKKSGTVVLIDK